MTTEAQIKWSSDYIDFDYHFAGMTLTVTAEVGRHETSIIEVFHKETRQQIEMEGLQIRPRLSMVFISLEDHMKQAADTWWEENQ